MTQLQDILLRRQHTVFVPVGTGAHEVLVAELEAELAGLGYVLAADLRAALVSSDSSGQLIDLSRRALGTLSEARGAHVHHVAQFRKFPASTPRDTVALYVERVLSWLFQEPNAPCLFCDASGAVNAVNPCGHLVCSSCFDGADYSGCPICHQRIDATDPFLKPAPSRGSLPLDHMGPLVRLSLGGDARVSAWGLAESLLSRKSPLSPAESDDLLVLIAELGPDIVEAAPESGIPVRETQALVFGTLLKDATDPAEAFARIAPHLKTATDVLRLVNVWMGGDAGLVDKRPRLRGMSRPLRRQVLERLEALPLDRVGEDMNRHRERWIRVGEALRPFEYHKRYPQTALAFASLRRTRPSPDNPLGKTLRAATVEGETTSADTIVATATRVKVRSFAAKVEAALERSDLPRAIELLEERPGDLARRFDHLLRLAEDESALVGQLVAALETAAEKLPTPLTLTLRGALRRRTESQGRRVFFPRGAITKAYGVADQRPPLSKETIDRAVSVLDAELSRRAGKLPKVTSAVIDEALSDLLVPVAERTASKALVTLPRGSALPLPSTDEKLRLFLHWTETPEQRIDLDLSVAFFNSEWHMVALCDYTQLRAFHGPDEDAAVHSGDLTSAPAPLGASEFVDLDLGKLRARGIRHAAMVVFSYNDVPFDQMSDAFAGFMHGRDEHGEIFDPRTVEQRFDLAGDAKMSVPMLIDVEQAQMRWVDVHPSAGEGYHSASIHRGQLAHLCCDLHDYFAAGARPTLFEVAALHAGARAGQVQVRRRDGRVETFARAEGESAATFTDRLIALEGAASESDTVTLEGPVFAALVKGDLSLPSGSESYSLRTEMSPEATVTQLEASDLVSAL